MTPADFAQAQLDRYNAHDLDGFMALYAEEVEVFTFPATPFSQGKSAMRERYAKILFAGSTVKAVVSQRMVQGKLVIDHEQITGHPLLGDCTTTVIYQVGETHIEKIWFIR